MKYTILLLLVPGWLFGQTALPVDQSGNVQFQEVVKVDTAKSAKDIISLAKTWVAKSYNSANNVIQQYDPEQGILIVKAKSTLRVLT